MNTSEYCKFIEDLGGFRKVSMAVMLLEFYLNKLKNWSSNVK